MELSVYSACIKGIDRLDVLKIAHVCRAAAERSGIINNIHFVLTICSYLCCFHKLFIRSYRKCGKISGHSFDLYSCTKGCTSCKKGSVCLLGSINDCIGIACTNQCLNNHFIRDNINQISSLCYDRMDSYVICILESLSVIAKC